MRITINGFGRIGRIFLRTILERRGINVVAINDLSNNQTLAHLFKYDSVHRSFKGAVNFDDEYLYINNNKIKIVSEANPANLPWEDFAVDLVIESTGRFTSKQDASRHL